MSRPNSDLITTYIADGFADDCEELIHRCSGAQPLTYPVFAEIWKDMNFASMYKDRSSTAEIAELSEESIHIAKHYMVADTSNFEESVAGVFLVYTLLNLQPFHGFAALRLCPNDIEPISRIEVVARRERRYDVLRILADILIKGPTQYHAVLRPCGFETGYYKYFKGKTIAETSGLRPKGVLHRQTEEVDIMRDLHTLSRRYYDAKARVGGRPDRNLNYMDRDLVHSLDINLKSLVNGLSHDGTPRPRVMDEIDVIQAVKIRAMQSSVNELRHLTSVNESTSPKFEKPKVPKLKEKTVLNLTKDEFALPKSPRKYHLKFASYARAVDSPSTTNEQNEMSDDKKDIEIPVANNTEGLPVISEEIFMKKGSPKKNNRKRKHNVKKNNYEDYDAKIIVPEMTVSVGKEITKKNNTKKRRESIEKQSNDENCNEEMIVPEIIDSIGNNEIQANKNELNENNCNESERKSYENTLHKHMDTVTKAAISKNKCKQEKSPKKLNSVQITNKNQEGTSLKKRSAVQITRKGKSKRLLKRKNKSLRHIDSGSSEDETDFELVLNDSDDDYSVTDDIDAEIISIAENDTKHEVIQATQESTSTKTESETHVVNEVQNSNEDPPKISEDTVVNINEKLNRDLEIGAPILVQTENGKDYIEIEIIDHIRRPNLRKRKITAETTPPKKDVKIKRKSQGNKEDGTSTNDTVVPNVLESGRNKANSSSKKISNNEQTASPSPKKKPILHPKLRNKKPKIYPVDNDVTITRITNETPLRRITRQSRGKIDKMADIIPIIQNGGSTNTMADIIPVIPFENPDNQLQYPLKEPETGKGAKRYLSKRNRKTLNRMGILPVANGTK